MTDLAGYLSLPITEALSRVRAARDIARQLDIENDALFFTWLAEEMNKELDTLTKSWLRRLFGAKPRAPYTMRTAMERYDAVGWWSRPDNWNPVHYTRKTAAVHDGKIVNPPGRWADARRHLAALTRTLEEFASPYTDREVLLSMEDAAMIQRVLSHQKKEPTT